MKIGKKAESVELGVEKLGSYTVQLAIATEGVASIEDLLNRIKSSTRTIKREAATLAYDKKMLAKTHRQESSN